MPQFVIISKSHPLSQYPTISRRQLDGETALFLRESKDILSILYSRFVQSGCQSIKIHLEDSMQTLFLKIACKMRFTILAVCALQYVTPELDLAYIPLQEETIPFCAYWHKNNSNPSIIAFLQTLRNITYN